MSREERDMERHETPEFLDRVKDFRDELKRLKQIEEDDSPGPDEDTRKARQNLSEDQEQLAAELDAIIQEIGERLNRVADAKIPLNPAYSSELTDWYETTDTLTRELTLLRTCFHELRKVGIRVPLFREATKKLSDARTQAWRSGLIVNPSDWRREDRMRGYKRIHSILRALGVINYPYPYEKWPPDK